MSTIDSKSKIKQEIGLNIQAISSDTTTNGTEIDTVGFESLVFIQQLGTATDGDYTLLIEDSDVSGSGYVAVADDFLIGTEADTQLSTSNTTSRIGYVGKKRYVRASVVSANTTTGATLGVLGILGHADVNPTA